MTAKRLTLEERQEIFHDLVTHQDEGAGVQDSYRHIVKQHGVTEEQLKRIEEEGIANEWPPLDAMPKAG